MNKIEEAQIILKDLGLPKSQQNEISALTLLHLFFALINFFASNSIYRVSIFFPLPEGIW